MGKTASVERAPSLRLQQLPALWPELVISQALQAELAQWEHDMAQQFAMSPSVLKPEFLSGKKTLDYYEKQSTAFGDFVRNRQLTELTEISRYVTDLSPYTFRTIGIGQGHDLEGLVIAARLFEVQIKAYDWATSALQNGAAALEGLLARNSLQRMSPRGILERAELEQLVGINDHEPGWPHAEGRLSMLEVESTILISISRVLQHMDKARVIRVLRGLGRILTLNPKCRLIIVHPYPEDALNQPIQDKYRTAYPYDFVFFLRQLSEGAGQSCVELRRSTHEFMGWQLYSASTFGLQ